MYRAIAAILAMGGLAARAAVGYGPVDCGEAPPCGCEPIVICDPCALMAEPMPPQAPDKLPPPLTQGQAAPQPDEGVQPTPAAPSNAFPSPPNVNTPATEPPTPPATPPAEETPTDEQPTAPITPPAEEAPASTEPPASQEAPPADDASRYGTPPADESATPATDSYEGLFPPDDAAAELKTPATETPATESPSTEEAPGAEESPPTPDYDELFPPSSGTGVLSAPGGWASKAPRSWKDADGRILAIGRILGVTTQQVVLAGHDGSEQAFLYAALSNEDLRFLREQVAARRAELQVQEGGDKLLAGQR